MSNRTLTIILGVLIAVALVLTAVWLLRMPAANTGAPNQNSGNPFGGGSNGGSPAPGGSSSATVTVTTKSGSSVEVPDFRSNHPSAREDNLTQYYLTNNQATKGDAAQFDIVYNSDSTVLITLLSEPLSSARLAGETALRSFFPLTDAQLCSLKVTVATIYSVNAQFSGENLGLSFCPGSVKLP